MIRHWADPGARPRILAACPRPIPSWRRLDSQTATRAPLWRNYIISWLIYRVPVRLKLSSCQPPEAPGTFYLWFEAINLLISSFLCFCYHNRSFRAKPRATGQAANSRLGLSSLLSLSSLTCVWKLHACPSCCSGGACQHWAAHSATAHFVGRLRWEWRGCQPKENHCKCPEEAIELYRALPTSRKCQDQLYKVCVVEGGRKRSGRRDVRYAVRVDFSFLIDILGKVNEKGFRIKQALIQRNLLWKVQCAFFKMISESLSKGPCQELWSLWPFISSFYHFLISFTI